MITHADKTQENKNQSVSSGESKIQSGGEPTFQFVGNQPGAIAQGKLQEMANNSPHVKQLRALQDMANNSLQMKQLGAIQEMVNNSPHMEQIAQLQEMADNNSVQQKQSIQKKENNTGLPDKLKTGMENLSGVSLEDVKVHRNSDKPALLQAYAYAQGTDIHIASVQEKHLPHEAWHVVQQKQGRVKPTMQIREKVNVNDDSGLENEAELMGMKAVQFANHRPETIAQGKLQEIANNSSGVIHFGELQEMRNTARALPGQTVLQPVWIREGIAPLLHHRWDIPIAGKQWYYDPETDKYHYTITDYDQLDLLAHQDAFELYANSPNFEKEMKVLIMRKGMVGVPYGYYFTEADEALTRFDQRDLFETELRPEIKLCMDYKIDGNVDNLTAAASTMLGGGALTNPWTEAKLQLTFDTLYGAAHFSQKTNGFGRGQSLYVRQAENYQITPLARKEDKLKEMLQKATWAAMGKEVEALATTGMDSDENVLSQENRIQVDNFTIYFTRRVTAESTRLAARQTTQDLLTALAAMSSGTALRDAIEGEMAEDFKRALTTKDLSIGRQPDADNEAVATGAQDALTGEQLDTYCQAVIARWDKLLAKNILVVFDKAGFSKVFGKTPENEAATPANLMDTSEREDDGLPDNPSALINLDSENNLITLAHELAHVIGFNPTDCDASGHFTTSNSYLTAEGEFGPKLLFDAYYFETLISKFIE